MKIEMQKITDKQFILLVFIHTIFKWYISASFPYLLNNMKMKNRFLSNENSTKISRKWTKFSQWGQKFRRKYIEICDNFERISYVHFREFRSTKISMETISGIFVSNLRPQKLCLIKITRDIHFYCVFL